MTGALNVRVDSKDLQKLFYELKAAGDGLQVELRRGVREAAAFAVEAVKKNASWSTRIPNAVQAKPFFTAKGAGVTIVVDQNTAPEGRPLEHGGKPGNFRHPVHGNRSNWVSQPARPFFYDSIEKNPAVDASILAVMERVTLKAGMK
jgi:hypothetical protein